VGRHVPEVEAGVEPAPEEGVEGQLDLEVEVEVHADGVALGAAEAVVDRETFVVVARHTNHPHLMIPQFAGAVLGE
jgi:hypothetical protein